MTLSSGCRGASVGPATKSPKGPLGKRPERRETLPQEPAERDRGTAFACALWQRAEEVTVHHAPRPGEPPAVASLPMHRALPSLDRYSLGVMVLAAVLVVGAVAITVDAARQRRRQGRVLPEMRAAVRLLGTADMALSSASRWLRHPSLSEPGAAFADAPAILDADPAGALIAPPPVLWSGINAGPVEIRKGRGTP